MRSHNSEELEKQKELLNGLTTELPFSLNALQVLAKRYLLKDLQGTVLENPEGMFRRIAHTLAEVEFRYGKDDEFVHDLEEQFYDVMAGFEFTPAGRTLTNAGAPTPVVSNCIVLHPEDSMESIFQTLKEASLLQQAGSGLGFPFHLLRPAGSVTKASRGVASGPVSFLRVYNEAFGVIKQQNRHGANMAVMRVDHPDILEFIHCKEKEGEIGNFNISVGLTNDFMQAVKNNDAAPWMCEWNGKKMKPRRIERTKTFAFDSLKEVTMTASELFMEIINCAWKNGEPGCVFLDKVNETNPVPSLGRIEACNPCGEQFLHDGDVCNLGSINLEHFVKDGEIDFDRLTYVTRVAVRLLDNVIDISDFPVKKVNDVFRSNRRIGLGIMGFADMLYKLGVGYNTSQGFAVAERVMKCIQDQAHQMSGELAEEKGVFPNWEGSIFKQKGIKMRNAALTNIAPTGTISMMFDVSSGVEPYFALAYVKHGILGGKMQLYYTNKHLKGALESVGLYRDDLIKRITEEGTLQYIDEIPDRVKRVFVTAMDISAEDHINIQAAFQKYCDNAISKTINFPNSATKDDVLKGYLLAWELGCKGCTVYRDGSREIQVLSLTKDKKPQKQEVVVMSATHGKTSASVTGVGKKEVIASGVCPDCGGNVAVGEGCYTCTACGTSACSL